MELMQEKRAKSRKECWSRKFGKGKSDDLTSDEIANTIF